MYDGMKPDRFLAALLGALVEQQGGIVAIDKAAFDNFRAQNFYAVKLDFVGDDIILEVLDEDPVTKSTGENSDKG